MSYLSEAAYWEKFLKENDEKSFSQLYKNYVANLYAYGVSLGFPADTCMDAVQDVFYKLYVRRKEMSSVTNLRFYLLRSMRNRLFDIYKQQKNMESLEVESHAFPVEVSVSEHIENEEDRLHLRQKIENLLQLLTNRQREAVYLRYMQGVEYEDIAEIMKMTPESVRKLVYRALQAIRKNTNLPVYLTLMYMFG